MSKQKATLLCCALAAAFAASSAQAVTPDAQCETVIVGAGGAGMRTAIALKEAGRDVILVEKLAFAGGATNLAATYMTVVGTKEQAAVGKVLSLDDYVARQKKINPNMNEKRIREVRANQGGKMIYTMDFQNDGEFVGGCIAGGRNYFHINSNGDAEPCVFIHYSNVNIKDHTLLEVLKSPLFMAYHHEQPFNRDHLRPCPMLENPEMLQRMVTETGAHSTDLASPESVEHLCAKCAKYAADWAPVADDIWKHEKHKNPGYVNYDPNQERGVFKEDAAE